MFKGGGVHTCILLAMAGVTVGFLAKSRDPRNAIRNQGDPNGTRVESRGSIPFIPRVHLDLSQKILSYECVRLFLPGRKDAFPSEVVIRYPPSVFVNPGCARVPVLQVPTDHTQESRE